MKVIELGPPMTDVAGDGQEREDALCFSVADPCSGLFCPLY